MLKKGFEAHAVDVSFTFWQNIIVFSGQVQPVCQGIKDACSATWADKILTLHNFEFIIFFLKKNSNIAAHRWRFKYL